jgi:peroxiredoxin
MSSIGHRIPDVPVWARAASADTSDPQTNPTQAVSSRGLWARGVHLVFGVPAAFSPQCQTQHLSGYVEQAENLHQAGVDGLWCLAVNDPFVMSAWVASCRASDRLGWVADANAELSRALGLDLCLAPLGMGTRCKRFAMLIRDGQVLHLAVEPPGQLMVSAAPYMLSAVRSYLA